MIKWIVIGRRWFDKINGNTYHSITITSTNKRVIEYIPMTYGYGDQYRQTALDWLVKNKFITEKDIHDREILTNKFYFEVIDVGLKRDL